MFTYHVIPHETEISWESDILLPDTKVPEKLQSSSEWGPMYFPVYYAKKIWYTLTKGIASH